MLGAVLSGALLALRLTGSPAWIYGQSDHFQLVGQVSSQEASAYLDQLERFDWRVKNFSKNPMRTLAERSS